MVQDVIDRLIAGTYADPDGGPPLRVETRAVVIAKSLAGMEADIVRPLSLGRRLAVVSDPTTHAILGDRVERALMSLGEVSSIVLPEHPHPDDATVERVRAATSAADALVAVGSGTINDLCKYASARDRKPYVVFGTAPSMNGYTSLECRHHGPRAQEVAAGAGAGRRVPRPLDSRGRAGADDPLGARRQPVPRHRAGRLAARRTCCSTCPIAPCRSCCWRRTSRTCSRRRRRW